MMKTIYKLARTELQSLFYSPVAWLILVVFTVQVNIVFSDVFGGFVRTQELGYTLGNVTMRTYAGFMGLFTNIQQYLYFYIPLLTMGLMSRELGSGSIKLLYSSPVTNTQIILGKYLSVMIYGLVLIGVLAITVFFGLCTIKSMDVPGVLSGLLGLYLLLCAYAAIGLFMSSLTSYQVVAAMGTFAVLAALNFVGQMWQDIELVRDITWWLAINGRSDEFINGLICSEDVLYFVIVISLFLTLSIFRLKAIRQKTRWSLSVAKYAGAILFACLAGYLSSRPQLMGYYDATRTKARTLTPNSQDIISRLEGKMTITTYVNFLAPNYWDALPRQVNMDLDRFKQYRRFKPEIKFKYVYYYDKADNPELERQYPGLSDRERMVKMSTSWRLDSNLFKSPEEIRRVIDLEPEGNRFVRLLERESGEKTFLRLYDDMQRHPNEAEISAAFKRLAMELPLVGFVRGHGERDCIREGDRDYNRFAQDKVFRYSLINNGFDFKELTLDREIPSDIDILVIADMKKAMSQEELEVLQHYVGRGGNLLIAGEPRRQEEMNPLLDLFGVRLVPGRLVRKSENFQPDFIIANPTREAGELSYIFQSMIHYELVATMPGCAGLEYDTDRGYTVTPLFVSDTLGSWNEVETTDFVDDTVRLNSSVGEEERAYPVMLALSRTVNKKEQRIVILGDADCISNAEISIARKHVRAANYSLINASFFWMSNEEVPIDVRRPSTPDNKVYLGATGMYFWKIVLIGLIPLLMAAGGVLIWIRRKGR